MFEKHSSGTLRLFGVSSGERLPEQNCAADCSTCTVAACRAIEKRNAVFFLT